ncbi:MAG: alanyl-tRNA editing protein [Deltaproteobacteria bacterium]|nr:alanyl-tRNA editing protein [Deltaproteobacteria bacterium]
MPLLLCQKDSYAQTVVTAVRSCTPGPDGYAVALEDTVLYPEGGGQPADAGTVAGFPVKAIVKRPDGEVVHLLDQAVVGRVEVAVDWARRYDHMQQHTAQHVLSAIGEDRYNLNTTAFHLGADRSDVDLDAADIDPGTLKKIEDEVNTVIRADLPVTVSEVDPAELGRLGVRTRGLPEGCTGAVRVVEIVGVDRNNCGGTHVRRTAEIQVFKITQTEPMRGGTRVHFLAGARAVRAFDELVLRERALTAALSCGPAGHEAAAKRLLDDSKAAAKTVRALRVELAGHLGAALASGKNGAALHRPDADLEFVRAIASAAAASRPGVVFLVTGGADSGEGVFALAGPEAMVKDLGPRVAEALGGRGGGSRGVFQGKASKIEKRGEAAAFLGTA